MARLAESPEVLNSIRLKAYFNARLKETYGKRARFEAGRPVADFESQCNFIRSTRLTYVDPELVIPTQSDARPESL